MSSVARWICVFVLFGACGEPDGPPPQSGAPRSQILNSAWRAAQESALDSRLTTHREGTERALHTLSEASKLAAAMRRERAEAERIAAEQAALEARFPKHGVVYHYLGQVFAGPRRGKPVGYMRRGSKFRAGPALRGPGCQKGWHRIPGEGFVCHGNGFLVGDEVQTFDPSPVAPKRNDALPYQYAYTVVEDRPQYWRLPTVEEEEQAVSAIALMREKEAELREAESSATTVPDEQESTPESDTGGAEASDAGAEAVTDLSGAVEAPPPPGESEQSEGFAEQAEAPVTEDEVSPLPSFVRGAMRKGFYVSIDRQEATDLGRQFFRTVRGGYVRVSDLLLNEPPESRGIELGAGWELPLGIVYRLGTHHYQRNRAGNRLRDLGTIERHSILPISDDIAFGDRRYLVSDGDMMVRKTATRVLRRRSRPEGVGEQDQWIHVDLSEQTVVAYEGDRPVYGTLASTGTEGHDTPMGLFRIESKHVSTTMDDLTAGENAYSIEDVPWTMYFEGNYALHGAFWHYTFGRVRSHGCVNLAPADARWFFEWSTPSVPEAWHGIFSSRRNPGTFVFVES